MMIKKEWKYHMLLAIVLIALNYFEDYVLGGKERFLRNFELQYFWLILTFYITSVIVYFINFKVICPLYLKKNRIIQFLIAILVLILVYAGIRFVIEEVVLYQITGQHNYYENSRRIGYYIFDNSYYAIKAILYSTLIYLVIKFMETIDHNKAELDLLKSQISPHFLFNTLNAFYVELIDDKPNTAKDIHKLSELLRYVTYDSQEDFVLLKNEIAFLKDYIHFFNKRYENELSVDFLIEGEVGNQKIPSLILIHFVENLFKHGVINDKNDRARIYILIHGNTIELKTKNKLTSSEKYVASGIGNTNVKKRLSTLFGFNYDLKYENDPTYFYAYLKMPL